MKRVFCFFAAILISIGLTACGTTAKKIQMVSASQRTDIFNEVADNGSIPAGFGDVVIKANIKTHLPGYYIGESKESVHGKPFYPFLINIGGQAAIWNAPGVIENKPGYDQDGKPSRDPEARDGMKYILEKKIRLAAGSHKVILGLPEDDYFIESEITVQDGETTVVEFRPVYRYKTMSNRIPTFLNGISRYDLFLNGNRYAI